MSDEGKDYLTLKWGTLKAWCFKSTIAKHPKAADLLREYDAEGSSYSAMLQHDTPRQKEILCDLIDLGDFETVYLDWDGEDVSKEKAKEYVMGYGAEKKTAA